MDIRYLTHNPLLILVAVLILGLSACDGSSSSPEDNSGLAQDPAEVDSVITPSASTETEEMEIADVEEIDSPISGKSGIKSSSDGTELFVLIPETLSESAEASLSIKTTSEYNGRPLETALNNTNYFFDRPDEWYATVVIYTSEKIEFILECDQEIQECRVVPFGQLDDGAYVFDSKPNQFTVFETHPKL